MKHQAHHTSTPLRDPKPTCLIIEDSTFDQIKLTRIINQTVTGMDVFVATTLKAARLKLANAPVTIILLDNNLPDGLGANFALELAATENLAHIPVIMVSDWPSPFMWEKAASAGVLHVVNKSDFGKRYLVDVLKRTQTGRNALH